jgi:signal transduction histidine kinase
MTNTQAFLEPIFRDCFEKNPEAHIHSIRNYALPKLVSRKMGNEAAYSAVFIPLEVNGKQYAFLGLVNPDFTCSSLVSCINAAKNLIMVCHHQIILEGVEKRLYITEHFVKEIGHDIASYAQATLGKARRITKGNLSNEAVARLAKDIEREVVWACSAADYFGLAIDSNYQIREKTTFSFYQLADEATKQFASEAKERHIEIELRGKDYKVHGDKGALRQAIGHILLNAIKYAWGGTTVVISVFSDGDEIGLTISNSGSTLPKGEDAGKIWDFGYRGKNAKEAHVNGSGIGLYTVKKVVLAHNGRVWAEPHGRYTLVGFALPAYAGIMA